MASLVNAGFAGATLFCEPGTALPPVIDEDFWPIVRRPERYGAWRNWVTALGELVAADPSADAVMLCQDDVIFCRGLREYLEKTLWPPGDERVGLCSPYSPAPYRKPKPGWHQERRGLHLVGALCWVFPQRTAEIIARDWAPLASKHNRGIDRRIGDWCERTGHAVWYHTPSLAQHVGNKNSALGDPLDDWMRRAHDFVGEDRTPAEAGLGGRG